MRLLPSLHRTHTWAGPVTIHQTWTVTLMLLCISHALSLAKRHLWNTNHYLSSVVGKRFQTICKNLFSEIKGTTTCQAEYIYTENVTFMSSVYSQLESFQKEFLPSKTWYDFVVEILDGQLQRQAYRKGNKVECILGLHCASLQASALWIPTLPTVLFVYHGADSQHATLI